MDAERFDNLSRRLAAGISRRAALRAALAAIAGAAGLRSEVVAQVSPAQCGNQTCANRPHVCNDGCVCCTYMNAKGKVTNSRCRPPGTCAPGTAICPPGEVVDPILGCRTVSSTTTTTSTTSTTTSTTSTTSTTATPTTTTTSTTTTAAPCTPGNCACVSSADCPDGGACVGNRCQIASCSDGVRNGAETDVDCGRPDCPPCVNIKTCDGDSDCTSAFCFEPQKVCTVCNTDGAHNDAEVCDLGPFCCRRLCVVNSAYGRPHQICAVAPG